MLYIGADGCKGNWLTVALGEGNHWAVNLFPNIRRIGGCYPRARLILLDIPIGLPEGGERERRCDTEARQRLGARRFSVFRVPCRAAVQAESYEEASRINQQRTGRKLSIQMWRIVPKIKEVDVFLGEQAQARWRIREVHPEVCFWALNGGRPMAFNKRSEEGIQERLRVLRRVYRHTEAIVNYAVEKYRGIAAPDDVLDALVAAVTASNEKRGLMTLPENPDCDAHGLPMEMVYYPAPW